MYRENKLFDVVVIGGGVVGGLILRKLTKYKSNVCLVEKAGDVAMGESKANSGIVHAGFDAPVGSLKAKFNVEGNKTHFPDKFMTNQMDLVQFEF